MVPDKFDMVDMGGIDLIESQGVAVEGLYQKLVESIALCRYQCLYNWNFNGILIPPSYVEMEVREDGVWINEGVMVDEEDVVHIYSIEPEPPAPIEPDIEPLTVTENGEYYAPVGVDGYNPVVVNVPSYEPVLDELSVVANGTYTPPSGVDGFNEVVVNVPTGGSSDNILYNGDFALNTTGLTFWDGTNTGTSANSRMNIIDGWNIMQCTAEKVASGIKIVPKKAYAYLTCQIPQYWFVGKSITLKATINGIEYTATGTLSSSGASISVSTPSGEVYCYAYSSTNIVFTINI